MKSAYVLLYLFLAVGAAQAQTFVGIRAGGSYSKVNGISSAAKTYDWVSNLHGGVFLNTNIGDKISLQPELVYSPKGFTFIEHYSNRKSAHRDTIRYEQNATLHYLDVPILMRLQGRRYYFEAGLQFSYLVSGHRKDIHTTENSGVLKHIESEHDMKLIAVPLDIGIALGFGYQTDSGVGIGFRYNQGFREIVDQQNWHRNVLLQASVFYMPGYSGYMKRKNAEMFTTTSSTSAGRKGQGNFKILSKINVQRVRFIKVGESPNPQVEFRFRSARGQEPDNVFISGSSGTEENGMFTGFRNVQFPFKGSIRFSMPTPIGTGSIESYLEFELTEPGIWQVEFLK